jgi:hypothetical protein
MRKVLIALATAGAALIAASPAAAQYYQQPYYGTQPYAYGYNAYGHGNWGEVRALQARIDNVERQIRRLDRRDVIRDRSADRLRYEADRIEHRLHYAVRNGLNPYEANDIRARIDRLEQQVHYAIAYGYGRYGYGYNDYGHHGGYYDHDRDGRDDRYENDHGWDHDD